MQDNRLVLTPCDTGASLPAQGELLRLLRELGLAGEQFEWQGEQHCLPGERFLDLISFLGCSPLINIEPTTDGSEFCHIVVARFDSPRFLAGKNTRQPRCPACKQGMPVWRDWVDTPLTAHRCPLCGAELQLAGLNWRRSAAVACAAISIYGVHDSEAVPTELLLTALERHTGQRWTYFYQQY